MEFVSKVSPTNGNLNEDKFILSASSSDTHRGAINLFPIDFPNSFPLYDGRSTVTNLKYAMNCMTSSILQLTDIFFLEPMHMLALGVSSVNANFLTRSSMVVVTVDSPR